MYGHQRFRIFDPSHSIIWFATCRRKRRWQATALQENQRRAQIQGYARSLPFVSLPDALDSLLAVDVHSPVMRQREGGDARVIAIRNDEVTMHSVGDEQAVWKLEHEYWRFVEANDLNSYRGLWHDDFLGWPSMDEAPVRKVHITGWITSQTAKGLAFKLTNFKEGDLQVTGDDAVTCYWVTHSWLDAAGNGESHTLRHLHAWRKTAAGWRILGGMSMQVPASPR